MALTITGIPDCRAALGPSQMARAYQLAPGTSDYVTGGYVINAAQVDLEFLFGAWKIAVDNQFAVAYGSEFVLPAGSFGTTPKPSKTINLLVTQPNFSGAGRNEEILPGTNLSGVYWWAYFIGY